ncbi:hypothetical protein OFC58_32120, partial [Escherichia coli]|nr:hypothetical protein [Escherichia coli]
MAMVVHSGGQQRTWIDDSVQVAPADPGTAEILLCGIDEPESREIGNHRHELSMTRGTDNAGSSSA